MDQESKNKLQDLLSKPINEMEPQDKDFIRARRSYLTEAQQRDLMMVLEGETGEINAGEVDYSKMTKAELLAICKGKGIVVDEAIVKAEIIKLLEAKDE
jgi:hypothetical protein